MIISRLKGGMGNQMFQYAMALNVATKLNTNLKIDLCALLDRSKGDFVYRNYDLSIFNLDASFVMHPSIVKGLSKFKSSTITKILRNQINKGSIHIKEKDFQYQASFIEQAKDHTIFEGWFQSYKYFEAIAPQIREAFTFRNKILPDSQELLNKIQSSNAICLNVRRTDFLKVDNLNTTNKSYFLNAAKQMASGIENPTFFIFSDDVEWCRNNIKLEQPTTVVGHEHKGEKFGNYMQLMIACKHFIIPNSSFAWWATWLNQNPTKKVIAPLNWFSDSNINTADVTPPDWLRI